MSLSFCSSGVETSTEFGPHCTVLSGPRSITFLKEDYQTSIRPALSCTGYVGVLQDISTDLPGMQELTLYFVGVHG